MNNSSLTKKEVHPWELVEDKTISQLVFAYEAVLTEMRTHARADRTIKEWVKRLDFERDEFVNAMTKRAASEPTARNVTTVGGIECMGMQGRRPSGLDTAPEVLHPCPFCGYEAAFKEGPRHTDDRGFHVSVWCTNGACAVHTPEHYANREAAATAWNRRAQRTT